MSAVDRVLPHFKQVKRTGYGWQAACPAHDDQKPSLSIHEGRDGRVLLKCQASCDTQTVVAAAGLEMSDLFDDDVTSRSGNSARPQIVAEYRYVDEAGAHLFDVVRFDPKNFKQRAASGQWKMDGVRRVPYRLPQLRAGVDVGRHIFIVEGEKDVDALVGLGFVATCNSGGAGKWRAEYNEHFRGAHVAILPDNDDPGRAHARDIATTLLAVATDVRVLELPGLPVKGDASDFLGAGGTAEQLKTLVLNTPIFKGAAPAAHHDDDDSAERPIRIDDWPNALNAAALIGPAGELVRTVAPHTEADPVAILVQFLVAFGNALNRSPHYQVEADRHYLNLFALIVGNTATGRKGTSWGHVRSVLAEADPEWEHRTTRGLSSGEGLIWQVRDAIERSEPVKEGGRIVDYQTVVEDPGVLDKRLLVIETEFARPLRAMQREGNTLSTVLREGWDSGNLNTMTKTSPARASGAHISLIGHITKIELQRLLDRTDVANGFLNRFLVVSVRRSKCLPDGGSLAPHALAPIVDRVREALDFGRRTERMMRDAGAKQLWHGEYQRLTSDKPGAIGAVTSRAAPQVMRIACLYALLDLSRDIRFEHLAAALELNRYVEESVAYVFGDKLGDATANAILEALRACAEGLTRTQIRDALGRHAIREDVDRALGALAGQGLANVRRELGTGGRPRELWSATKATKATEAPTEAARDADSSLMSLMSQAVEQHATTPHATTDSHNQPPQSTHRMRVVV